MLKQIDYFSKRERLLGYHTEKVSKIGHIERIVYIYVNDEYITIGLFEDKFIYIDSKLEYNVNQY